MSTFHVLWTALCAAMLILGCGGPSEEATSTEKTPLPAEYEALEVPEEMLADPKVVAKGEAKYLLYCAACHGSDGKGRPYPSAPPIGQDLTEAAWRESVDARAVFHVIREGKPGTAMVPIRLPDQDTWELVAFVLDLSENRPPSQ